MVGADLLAAAAFALFVAAAALVLAALGLMVGADLLAAAAFALFVAAAALVLAALGLELRAGEGLLPALGVSAASLAHVTLLQ
jgi:hypothetical protein